jgi:FSR family fosmidomycin resistance protein-like MFS transporter
MLGPLLALAAAAVSLPAARLLVRRLDRPSGRRLLAATSVLHLTNDACVALLYPLLPVIAADLGLSYAEAGLVKAVFSGASSALQLPVGLLGERLGAYLVLVLGNVWFGLGLVAMATAGSYPALLAVALAGGLGGNAQHPLAAALVSRAVAVERRGRALGTLNFVGDVGKLVGPLVVASIVPALGWRVALAGMGAWTALVSLVVLIGGATVPPAVPAAGAPPAGSAPGAGRGFGWLLAAGALDTATRGAALTFLPFLVLARGMDAGMTSLLLGLIFAAGAAGKFACGWLGDRWGAVTLIVVTELATAASLVGFLGATPLTALPLALVFGFALNGTSSPLTAAVAHLAPAERRAWAYGVYFTATLVSSSLAPAAYGLLADLAGLEAVFLTLAAATAAIVVLVAPIRRALLAPA